MNAHGTLTPSKVMKLAQQGAQSMGLSPSKARPHELILYKKIKSSLSSYTFSLKDEQARKELSIANGLLDRNGFVAVGMAIGILQVPVIGGVEYPEAGTIHYHADTNAFAGPATNVLSEQQALNSFYQAGSYKLETNEGKRIDGAPTLSFRTVSQTQQTDNQVNMQTGGEVKELGVIVRFAGGDTNDVIITHECQDKTAIGGVVDEFVNYLCVRLVGAIVKGGTSAAYLNKSRS